MAHIASKLSPCRARLARCAILGMGLLGGAVQAQPASPLVALPAGWRLATEWMAGFPAEGLQLWVRETPASAPPVRAFCLAWDTRSPAVAFKPVLAATARTPSQLAAQEPGRVFAAINAGFFGGNQSFSLVQRDGAVLAANVKSLARTFQGAPTNYFPTRAAFGISAGGRLATDWIYHIGSGNNLIYSYPQPSPNLLNAAPQPVPTAAFPEGGSPWVMQHGIGGSPMLVKDGVVRVTDQAELIDVNNTSRRARSALGYTADAIVLFLAVEGDNPPAAPGLTLAELAALLRELGCVGAINLDGGGSTSLVAGGRTTVRPSDGAERPVISAVLLTDPAGGAPAEAAPVIVHPPWDLVVAREAPASLQVVASGGALAYQWQHNGVALAGATRAALDFASVTPVQVGAYAVVVTNSRGAVTSRAANLSVVAAAPGELVNLSVRAGAGPDEDTLIGGFALRDGEETILARAVGPSLGPLGVTGFLADPKLELFAEGGRLLAANDDWDSAAIGAAAARVGAFPLPPGSRDAALLRPTAAGTYTVAASPARDGSRGNLLIELYDTGSGRGTLANLSARARVSPAGGELIAGFYVRGDAAMTVLIRGVGPSLGELGVRDALPGPVLTLVRGGEVQLTNRAWALAPNAVAVRDAARRAGAFPLSGGTADTAMLVTLPPGAYTAVLAAPSGSAGVALVEVYELR